MKKWLLFLGIFLSGVSFSYGQNNIEEAYFHKLRGMVDSTGVTHLFYRQYTRSTRECTYEDQMGEMVTYDLSIIQNDVYHYDTFATSDSVKFRDGQSVWSDCYVRYTQTLAYTFFDNDPEKSIVKELYDTGFISPNIRNWKGDSFSPNFAAPDNIEIDSVKQQLLIPTPLEFIVAKSTDLPDLDYLRSTIAVHPDGSNWDQINFYEKTPDSLFYDFTILGINPQSNNEYFVVRKDSLFYSDNHGETLSFITDHSHFEGGEADIFFSNEEKVYYFSFISGHQPTSLSKKVWKLSNKEDEGWNFDPIELPNEATVHALDLENSTQSRLFMADSTKIYSSYDHAETFSDFMSFEDTITGLYKKPGSDILYVLTREELLEVNTETGESTPLKQLPVSNEIEARPSEVPRSAELHQNYPNPFNPATVIEYQLSKSSDVTLEVFDITGRRVAVLVNERQATGTHQVHFDASNLASGVYLYRLATGNVVQTRQMVLVK